jgi:hypothetical protein
MVNRVDAIAGKPRSHRIGLAVLQAQRDGAVAGSVMNKNQQRMSA